MKIRTTVATYAAASLMASGAFAQTTDPSSEIAELRDRVAELERSSGNRRDSPLRFDVGAKTEVELYGFVRAEAFFDFDFAQGDLSRAGRVGDDAFETDGEFDTSVRVSRFGIRSNTATDIGDIKTQLEFDLFGSGGEDSGSPNLRLRHANININDTFLVGQFWTNFQPLVHYPVTSDFNGPVGISFARVPQARYTYNNGDGLVLSASIEEAEGGGSDPVFTAAALYGQDDFSIRAAVLGGQFDGPADENFDTYGLTLSGSFIPFDGATLTATGTVGQALGNLLIGDGDRFVGDDENDSVSFTVQYLQEVGEKLTLGVAYGYENYDDATQIGSTANSFDELQSLHVSAFYRPVENLTIALEYIRIESEGPNGFDDSADRIGTSVTFSF